ncbi:MAG: hypothetical protein R2794_05265 [Chitinophagales bacterium]
MSALLYKQLFFYIIPLNFLVGEYNGGLEYRFSDGWATGINAGYVVSLEGTDLSAFYEEVFPGAAFYYQGPFVKVSILSVLPYGPNPLRTNYNQLEFSARFLHYNDLDFEDEEEPGKVFNISENVKALGLSWKAGYTIYDGNITNMSAFIGFGLQLRMKETFVNSYGYDYNSHQFIIDDRSTSAKLIPLFHIGLKTGLKALDSGS